MRKVVGFLGAVLLVVGETAKPVDPTGSVSSPYIPQNRNATENQTSDLVQIAATDSKSSAGDTSKRITRHSKAQKKAESTVSSSASASLRRIKKEYKDAVQMGICYDWVKGRLITSATTRRDSAELQLITLGPLATNLRHWHFSFRGVKNSLYESGIYHGRILLPKDYPSSPPRVQMMTPSGRFKTFADICLSASAFHPESWTPRWTILSLVQALRLHMLTNPQEIGGIVRSADDILEYARRSLSWHCVWDAGGTKIEVNHTRLIEQDALSIEIAHDEESEPSHAFESVSEITTESLDAPLDVESNIIEKGTAGVDGREIPEETATVESAVASTSEDAAGAIVAGTIRRGKGKRKMKKKTEKRKRGDDAHMTGTVKKTEEQSEVTRTIRLIVSKVVATPSRRSLLFLLLLWVISNR